RLRCHQPRQGVQARREQGVHLSLHHPPVDEGRDQAGGLTHLMDIIGFLNNLTGGNLLLWKVVAATVVFLLAGGQVFLAARMYRHSTVPPISPTTASSVHRWLGRITLTLAI